MRDIARPVLLLALLGGLASGGLAGCGPSDNDPGPGGVTIGEARALDEAAEMIEQDTIGQEAAEQEAAEQETAAPAPSGGDHQP